MKRQTSHTSQEQEQFSHTETHHSSAREFASAEDALREDFRQTVVPPVIEQRLCKSIEKLPKPGKPWWKRLMG